MTNQLLTFREAKLKAKTEKVNNKIWAVLAVVLVLINIVLFVNVL